MKKSLLSIVFLLILFLLPRGAFAVNEECAAGIGGCPTPPDASVCTAPPIIENVGGCPGSTVWIGGAATGQCTVPTYSPNPSCPGGTDSFLCETNTCYKKPIPGPPAACPTANVSTGSSLPCCTNDQLAVRDSNHPTGWKCENKPTSSLKDTAQGIIDFVNTLMTELGVENTNLTNIVTALTNLLNGGTPVQIAQYKTDLANALAAFTIPPSGAAAYVGVYKGTTNIAYNGNQGSYQAANAYCQADVPNSHVCSALEMINSYNNLPGDITGLGESVWVNNGPPGYISNVANDCEGWKSNGSTIFGYVWDGSKDSSYVTPCNLTRKFACCI